MKRPRRLWVVDPSIHEPEHQCVRQVLDGWPGDHRVFRSALEPGSGPGPGQGYDLDAAVVLGSGASVHEDRPWMTELIEWMRPILDGERKIPLLGICFGHQVVAHLAGARVGPVRPDGGKELGVRETLVEGGRLLAGRHELRVLVSHRETVLDAPPHYRVVARRPEVPFDGLEHETLPVFTFQFHPEAREEFAQRQGLPVGCVDERVRRDSNRLLEAFRDFARVWNSRPDR